MESEALNQKGGRVYADILETLTSGLYNKIEYAVREYLQNGYDAIKEAKKLGIPEPEDGFLVKVSISANSKDLLIFDNGVGMSLDLLKRYTSIGGGSKNRIDFTGHKGIGKLSGLRFFDKFVVRTKQAGNTKCHELVWDSGDMLSTLSQQKEVVKQIEYHEFIEKYIAYNEYDGFDVSDHFTQIQLLDVMDDFSDHLTLEYVGNFIKRNCPVPFYESNFEYSKKLTEFITPDMDFYDTTINDRIIYQYYNDVHGLVEPITKIIKYDSQDRAKVWFSWIKDEAGNIEDSEIRGIRFREKGICVGTADIFHNHCMQRPFDAWFTGEIIVLDNNITPNSARDGFIQGHDLNKFFKSLQEQVGKELSRIADIRSEINTARNDIKKINANIENSKPVTKADIEGLAKRRKSISRYANEHKSLPVDYNVIKEIDNLIQGLEKKDEKKLDDVVKNLDYTETNAEELIGILLKSKEGELKSPTKAGCAKEKEICYKATEELVKRISKQPTQQQIVVKIVTAILNKYNITVNENDIVTLYENELSV